jgi:hypothetical protein
MAEKSEITCCLPVVTQPLSHFQPFLRLAFVRRALLWHCVLPDKHGVFIAFLGIHFGGSKDGRGMEVRVRLEGVIG